MSVKLLTEHHLEFLSLKRVGGATQVSLSIHLSKCHILGDDVLICYGYFMQTKYICVLIYI